MAKEDFEDFLSRITFAESRGKRTDSSGKLLEGPMTKYGTAKGELQVLDSTNKKPGYGIVPAKDETPDERARVGRDYLKAMLDKFKDKRTAAIAYNWGPGNTQKWLDAGADEAGLPLETQNYVKKVMGTAVAKAPAPPDMAPAPRQAAGAPSVPGAPEKRPTVSRETVKTTVGVGPGTVGPGTAPEDRLSALGPSYQAAMALSYLADTTNPAPQEEDEDGELRISGDEPRGTAREDDEATKFLMEPSARTALADFDFKIQSPFAERPVRRMAKGGDAELTQEEIDAASRPSFGNPNMARQAAKTRSLQAARSNDVNTLPDPQTYAFTQGMLGEAPDQLGFSPTHPDYKKIIGRGEQGMVTGGVSMIGPAAKALKGLVGMGAKTLKPAASAAEISKDFLQRQKAVSSGPDGAARMAVAQRNAALPIEQGGLGLPANNTAMDRAAAMGFDTDVFHGTSKDFLTFNPDKEVFAAELPEIANLYGKYRKGDGQRIMPLKIRGKQLTISDMNNDGNTSQFGYNLAKKLNLSDDEIEKLLIPRARYPDGELIPDVEHLSTTFSDLGEREVINRLPKHGIDRLKVTDMYDTGGQQTQYMLPAGSDNVRSSFAAYDPFRRTAAVAAAMGAAAPDLLAGQEEKKEVNRAKGSPEEGEVSQEELDAASKPSFKAQSSGINRQRGPISDALTSGEAYTAAAKGFTNLPYNIAGAPMDLAMMVRQGLTGQAPAGQVGTSEYIKNKMTEFGIRQAPPTDPTLKGFYELGDLGSNLVNPAAPVRGAAKVAEKTGEAAKMLAKELGPTAVRMGEGYLERQGLMPGIVRPSGGLFPATRPADATAAGFEPISRIDDVFVELRKSIENKTDGNVESREASLKFVNNKLLDYFRTKAGSVGDPVREALITGKIKIPKNSQLEEDFPQALIDAAKKGDVTAMVAIEKKLDKDLNIKAFRKKQDNESVQKTEEESQKFTNFILQQMQESPGNIPDSLLLRLAKKEASKMAPGEAAALVKKMRQEMADNPNYFSLRLEPSIQRMITKDPDFKLESATGSDIQKYGNNIFKALKEAEKTKEGIMALSNDMPITDLTYRYPAFTLLGINSNDLPKIITKINPEELGRMGVPEFLNEAIKIKTKINEFEKIKNTLEKLINKNNFNFPKEISLYGTQPFLETSKGFTWREVIDPDAAALQGQMMDNSIGGYSRSGTYGAVRNGRAALEKKDVRIFSLYGPENTPLVNAEYITPSYVRKVDPSTGDLTGPAPNSLHQITGNGTRTKNAEPKDYGLPIFELMEKLGTDKIPYNIGAIVNPLPAPPSVIQLRAKGGFMERQSNDNRKYL